jgi:hypothetical protein
VPWELLMMVKLLRTCLLLLLSLLPLLWMPVHLQLQLRRPTAAAAHPGLLMPPVSRTTTSTHATGRVDRAL